MTTKDQVEIHTERRIMKTTVDRLEQNSFFCDISPTISILITHFSKKKKIEEDSI